MRMRMIVLVIACAVTVAAQLAPPVVVQIDAENAVMYRFDTADVTKLGSQSSPTPPLFETRTFMDGSWIADIVSVNGKPAKGIWVNHHHMMRFASTPQSGFVISDVVLTGSPNTCYPAFARPDGVVFGTLVDGGTTNHTVLGGTGIFFGATGQHFGVTPRPYRYASVSEDPSRRRDFGGGAWRGTYYLYPAFRPEVEMTTEGPAVFHSDSSPVTPSAPARSGEALIVRAKGLGPTTPDLLPPGARLFPADPMEEVIAPVDVTIDGKPAEVISKIGWPGTYDTYRLDVRVPSVAAGMVAIQITLGGIIPGPEIKIPTQ